jgi:hypothetical protein
VTLEFTEVQLLPVGVGSAPTPHTLSRHTHSKMFKPLVYNDNGLLFTFSPILEILSRLLIGSVIGVCFHMNAQGPGFHPQHHRGEKK